jgi:hypothetical protein
MRQFGPTYLGRDALPRVRLFRPDGRAGGFGLGAAAGALRGFLATLGWVHDVRLQDADLEDVADGQINDRLPAEVNVLSVIGTGRNGFRSEPAARRNDRAENCQILRAGNADPLAVEGDFKGDHGCKTVKDQIPPSSRESHTCYEQL